MKECPAAALCRTDGLLLSILRAHYVCVSGIGCWRCGELVRHEYVVAGLGLRIGGPCLVFRHLVWRVVIKRRELECEPLVHAQPVGVVQRCRDELPIEIGRDQAGKGHLVALLHEG